MTTSRPRHAARATPGARLRRLQHGPPVRLAPWPVDWLDPAEAIARRARSLLPRHADALHPAEDDTALFTGGHPDFATRRLMNSFGLKVA